MMVMMIKIQTKRRRREPSVLVPVLFPSLLLLFFLFSFVSPFLLSGKKLSVDFCPESAVRAACDTAGSWSEVSQEFIHSSPPSSSSSRSVTAVPSSSLSRSRTQDAEGNGMMGDDDIAVWFLFIILLFFFLDCLVR